MRATLFSLFLPILGAGAATLTWNNGASTGNWNTADANWTGSIWSNSNPDSAVFHPWGRGHP
ncbi:MAG: hypothetical protein U1F77_05165 [Kiritimatiellia bacterium]